MNQEKYYKVTAKCGHVGRKKYIKIDFPIKASSGKEAAKRARDYPRVKHDHKDAIINVVKISKEQYFELKRKNKIDPYLNSNNIQEQRRKAPNLDDRLDIDPHNVENDKKIIHRKRKNVSYKRKKNAIIKGSILKELKNTEDYETEEEVSNQGNNEFEELVENKKEVKEKTNSSNLTLENLYPNVFNKLIRKKIINTIKKFKYYDTHAHVNFSPMCEQADEILNDCLNQSILVNNIGTDEKDSLVAFNQAKKYKNTFCSVGFHPETFGNYTPEQCSNFIEDILKQNDGNIIAVGECGLDYTDEVDKQKQKQVFIKMIYLAKKYNLPLIVHVRKAHDDAIEILDQYARGIKKVIHCFTANPEIAKKYLKLGCYISVTGIVTFKKKVEDILASLKIIPMDRLLIETDCPFLTPEPYRGKQNKPQYVKLVFNKIKELYAIDEDKLIKQLQENAIRFFVENKK